MIVCALGSAASVGILLLPCSSAAKPYFICISATVQFTFDALYGPLRESLVPLLVPESDLQVIATLVSYTARVQCFCLLLLYKDSMAWSTIGAFGASLGGYICSTFGYNVAFLADISTFVSVACLMCLIPSNYENSSKVQPTTLSSQSGNYSFYEQTLAAFEYAWEDPKILCFMLIKGLGSLVWGAADIIQIKFSGRSSMQSLGDNKLTLGLIYSTVGVGCQIGPLLWNCCTVQDEKSLFQRVVICFALMTAGYLLLGSIGWNIYFVMLAIVVRTTASSTLWTYSSLLLQISVPADFKGRIFALENAGYTLCSILSTCLCGVLFDVLRMDEYNASLVIFCIGSALTLAWSVVYFSLFRSKSLSKSQIVYNVLSITDDSFELPGEEDDPL